MLIAFGLPRREGLGGLLSRGALEVPPDPRRRGSATPTPDRDGEAPDADSWTVAPDSERGVALAQDVTLDHGQVLLEGFPGNIPLMVVAKEDPALLRTA